MTEEKEVRVRATIELKELKKILDYYFDEYTDEYKKNVIYAICGFDKTKINDISKIFKNKRRE